MSLTALYLLKCAAKLLQLAGLLLIFKARRLRRKDGK